MTGFTVQNRRIVIWIVAGVFVWGAIHAVGAYLNFHDTNNPWRVLRAVMVLLCVEGFLGFWLLMLGLRRLRRGGGQLPEEDPSRRIGMNDTPPGRPQRNGVPDDRSALR
jgi:hypothetical protein